MSGGFQLAQYNIARLTHPLDAPESQGFVDRLAAVNAAAEAHTGYVWRLQTEEGDATDIDFYGDPNIVVNLTVWEDVESLKAYAYRGAHGEAFRKRGEWFDSREQPMAVLWWIAPGHLPSVEEADSRLQHLRRHGPSPHAFTFGRFFDAQDG